MLKFFVHLKIFLKINSYRLNSKLTGLKSKLVIVTQEKKKCIFFFVVKCLF